MTEIHEYNKQHNFVHNVLLLKSVPNQSTQIPTKYSLIYKIVLSPFYCIFFKLSGYSVFSYLFSPDKTNTLGLS